MVLKSRELANEEVEELFSQKTLADHQSSLFVIIEATPGSFALESLNRECSEVNVSDIVPPKWLEEARADLQIL
jgi:hypothetical protein